MNEWARRPVGDLIDGLTAGVSVRSVASTNGGPSVLKTSAVDAGRFDPSEAKTILPADLSRARQIVLADSMVVSRMNTPALVGDVGYAPETHKDLYLPDRLWIARAKRASGTDMRWLTYYFASGPGAGELRGLATGTSGSMKNIPKDRILGLEIAVPPTTEQQAIADALQSVDELTSTLERLIAKKQAFKTGMMQQLLTGRTRLPGFTKSWTHSTLGELGATVRGVSYNPDEDLSRHRATQTVDLLRANNVQGAELDLGDVQYVNQLRVRTDQFLRKDDVLICAANGSKRLVGKAARVESEPLERSTFGAFMMVFRPDPSRILPAYSALHFQTKSYRDLLSVLLAGSSINNLRPSDIALLEIPIPDRDEQIAIVASIDDLTAQIRILQTRLGKTQAVKRGMMQQLLTGRTRLPVEAAA